MNHLFEKIFFIVLLIITISCENIEIVEGDLPNVNLYIIDGQISPGITDPIINFTKSLPIDKVFDLNDAAITDVNAYIWSDDQGLFNLKHIGQGQYQPTNLKINPNKTYELYGEVKGTKIYAKTKVPAIPNVVSTQIVNNQIKCKIVAKSNEVYSCIYAVIENYSYQNPIVKKRESDFFTVVGPTKEGSILEIKTGIMPDDFIKITSNQKLAIEVYAWDKSYKDYFSTKENNKTIDDIFSQGGGLINWNVQGKNTIGLFIGYSSKFIFDFN